ncbi:MAG: hypothetical protein ACHP6H_02480 [Legionellales bacterium]
MSFDLLSGLSGAISGLNEERDPIWFESYKTKTEFAARSAAIITAPAIFTAMAVYYTLQVVLSLLEAIIYDIVLNQNLGSACGSLGEAFSPLWDCFVCLIYVVTSPVIEVIDVVGSGLATIPEFF